MCGFIRHSTLHSEHILEIQLAVGNEMANNWEDVAEYLLRNRNIREMVDEVLNSLDEIKCDMSYHTGKLPETVDVFQ